MRKWGRKRGRAHYLVSVSVRVREREGGGEKEREHTLVRKLMHHMHVEVRR